MSEPSHITVPGESRILRAIGADPAGHLPKKQHEPPITLPNGEEHDDLDESKVPDFIKRREGRPTSSTGGPPEPRSLGQAILEGADQGQTRLLHEVTHLRETLSQRYVPGWFRRILSAVFGIEDNRVIMAELGTMRDLGARNLAGIGTHLRELTDHLRTLRATNNDLADAIESRNERDQLRQDKAQLAAELASLKSLRKDDLVAFDTAIRKLRAEHADDLAAREADYAETLRERELDIQDASDHIGLLESRVADLEDRLRRIAETSALVDLKAAFKAAASAKTPQKIDRALDRLERAQLEVEKLVNTAPFLLEDPQTEDAKTGAEPVKHVAEVDTTIVVGG